MNQRLMPLRRVSSAGTMIVLPQEMIDQAANGGNPRVREASSSQWMPAGNPPQPFIHPQPDSRRFDFAVNINTRFNPKAGEGVTFGTLRLLADAYDLLRVIIERRKDQVEAFEWELVSVSRTKKAREQDIERATTFLKKPSAEYTWGQWLRAMLEDLLVCDAVCVVPRHTMGGDLFSLDLVDPATIKRVIDDRGMTPLPPDPAFQQVIKGIPVVNFTVEEMQYWIRNPRTWRIYGFSPVEWILITVNIALQRQGFTMSYFTEGNIPEALAAVPESWTTPQIREFQDYWDSLMSSGLGQRRRMKFVPMDPSKIKELKQPDHKNEFEEWLARLVCFAFSISPSALIKDMNRATADTNREIAQDEGLMPTMRFLKDRIDFLLQNTMGFPDLQFKWKMEGALDAVQQATVHKTYIDAKVLTPDEVREELERDALTPEEREKAFPTPVPPMLPGMSVPGDDDEGSKPPPKKPAPQPSEDDDAAAAKLLSKIVFAPTINVPEREVNVTIGDVNVQANLSDAAQDA